MASVADIKAAYYDICGIVRLTSPDHKAKVILYLFFIYTYIYIYFFALVVRACSTVGMCSWSQPKCCVFVSTLFLCVSVYTYFFFFPFRFWCLFCLNCCLINVELRWRWHMVLRMLSLKWNKRMITEISALRYVSHDGSVQRFSHAQLLWCFIPFQISWFSCSHCYEVV